jgi:hypothetical protein
MARRSAWAVALALVASCGFWGEDDFKGRRLGAGDAPWGDRGALAICMAPTLLGPPDSDPAGICLAAGAEPRNGCGSDANCRSRERCVCGLCEAQFCDGPSQCGSRMECNFTPIAGFPAQVCGLPCSSLAPCPSERDLCEHGFCTSRCAADADCQTGESCSSAERCVARGCARDGDCTTGAAAPRCAIQRNPAELREPALLESPLVLYLELRPAPGTGEIWRATTSDGGQSWVMDPPQAVLAPAAGEQRVGAPAVVRRNGSILLLFEQGGGGIGLAQSGDGKAFARQPGLVHGSGSSPGAAVLGDGTLLVYYEDGSGAIGLVTSADAQTFDDHGVVLTAQDVGDPLLWRFVDRIGQPAARRSVRAGREEVQLWFTGHGVETSSSIQSGQPTPPVANDSIGYAVSTDRGQSFAPYPFNPVFDRIENFVDHDQERTPAVAADGDGFLLLYGGADAMGFSTNLGGAVNPPSRR